MTNLKEIPVAYFLIDPITGEPKHMEIQRTDEAPQQIITVHEKRPVLARLKNSAAISAMFFFLFLAFTIVLLFVFPPMSCVPLAVSTFHGVRWMVMTRKVAVMTSKI